MPIPVNCPNCGMAPKAPGSAAGRMVKCPKCATAFAVPAGGDPRTQGAYIHCLTGWTDEAAREQTAQAGCDLFLTKPVDAAALLDVGHHDLRDPAERVRGLTKTEAEELLDWLEAHGAAGEVDYEEGQGFAVRCPGFRVEKDASGRLQLSRRTGPTGP